MEYYELHNAQFITQLLLWVVLNNIVLPVAFYSVAVVKSLSTVMVLTIVKKVCITVVLVFCV